MAGVMLGAAGPTFAGVTLVPLTLAGVREAYLALERGEWRTAAYHALTSLIGGAAAGKLLKLPNNAPGGRVGSVTHSPDWRSIDWGGTNSKWGYIFRNEATPAEASIKDVIKNG